MYSYSYTEMLMHQRKCIQVLPHCLLIIQYKLSNSQRQWDNKKLPQLIVLTSSSTQLLYDISVPSSAGSSSVSCFHPLCFSLSASLCALCFAWELVLPTHPEQADGQTKILLLGMLFSLKNSANLWTIRSCLQQVMCTIFRLVHSNELALGLKPTLLL